MVTYAEALGLRPQSGVALLSMQPDAVEGGGAVPGRQQSHQSAIAGGLASLAPDPQPAAGAAAGGASGGYGGGAGGGAGGAGGAAGGSSGEGYGTGSSGGPLSESAQAALMAGAAELGMDPRDLSTIISYETGGRFDPNIRGGMNKDGSGKGSFMGLIQFDPANQRRYGLKPGMTFEQQMPAVVQYFKDRGYRPGMDLAHAYAIVNHGSLLPDGSIRNISDVNGNVNQHVARMRQGHGARARGAVPLAFGGGGWNGATGIAPQWAQDNPELVPPVGSPPASAPSTPAPAPAKTNSYAAALDLGAETPITRAALYPDEMTGF